MPDPRENPDEELPDPWITDEFLQQADEDLAFDNDGEPG